MKISRNNSQADRVPVHSPQLSPTLRFFGSIIFAIVFLGGYSFGVYAAAIGGGIKTMLLVGLLASPFGVIGLLMLWSAATNFMGLFAPTATLTVDSTNVRRGSRLQIHWQIIGRISSVQSIEILLVGFEKSDETIEAAAKLQFSELFKETSIYKTTSPLEIEQGEFSWQVPDDVPVSVGPRPMEWSLRLRGEIVSWPDVYAAIDIQILN